MSLYEPSHDHDGDALTIGCPACIAHVRATQEHARWADAPLRRCTWRFTASGHQYTFALDVRVPAGVEPWQVDGRWMAETGPKISAALGWRAADPSTMGEACETAECCTIGAVVASPPSVSESDILGLFGFEAQP